MQLIHIFFSHASSEYLHKVCTHIPKARNVCMFVLYIYVHIYIYHSSSYYLHKACTNMPKARNVCMFVLYTYIYIYIYITCLVLLSSQGMHSYAKGKKCRYARVHYVCVCVTYPIWVSSQSVYPCAKSKEEENWHCCITSLTKKE